MKDISNFTSSFNINKTNNYNLSLQISMRGYTYCIYDTYAKEYVAIKHIGYGLELSDENLYDKIKENLAADAFLSKSYKSVSMVFVTRKSVIVPSTIFDKTKLKELAIKYENYGKIIGNRKVILYQGILSAERNLDNFIRATSELDPERYVTVLVGRKTKFVERYKAINPNLIHVDFIPAPDYLYFTSFAHIGIVTYKADSLNTMYCAPNKLFEYGAYGVPMLGNDIAGLKYTIEFCGCGLVCDENSVDSIKASIQRIEDNYQQFSKRAREYYNSVDNKMIIKKIVEMASSNLEAKI